MSRASSIEFCQVIYPATAKHVAKYESQPMHIIHETPALFRTVTEPFLQRERFDIEWVYNILAHKKEAESIVFENSDPEEGFIMVPDFKWDGRQVEDLYLVAIVHTRSIRSIRDLRAQHLPLLRNLWHQGCAAIKDKYGLPASQIRAYFHYQGWVILGSLIQLTVTKFKSVYKTRAIFGAF